MNGSLLQGTSGRVGQVVIYNRMGRWCMRCHVEHIRDRRSEAQLACRSTFTAMMRMASAMSEALALGLRTEARGRGLLDSNLFLRLNKDCFRAADGGEGNAVSGSTEASGAKGGVEVDYELLQVSCGPLTPVGETRATLDDGRLQLKFKSVGGSGGDRVQVYVFCPELGWGLLSLPVYRGDRRLALQLPDAMRGKALCLYVFCTDLEGRASATTWAGLLTPDGADTEAADGDSGAADDSSRAADGSKTASDSGSGADAPSVTDSGTAAAGRAASADTEGLPHPR